MRLLRILAGTALLVAAVSCHDVRSSEPLAGPLLLEDVAVIRGAELYAEHCDQCHPNGEAGIGPGIVDKPLPDFLMKLQVRAGLGVMPSFSDERISGQELDELMAYVDAMKERVR